MLHPGNGAVLLGIQGEYNLPLCRGHIWLEGDIYPIALGLSLGSGS